MRPFFHGKEGQFSCSLCIVIFQEDGGLFPWKRGPIFLLPLYGYFPGKLGSFSMVKRAHFPALFVWLFSSKMGPFFHGKYLILYQSVYQNEELRYIDNLAVGTGIVTSYFSTPAHQPIHDIINAQQHQHYLHLHSLHFLKTSIFCCLHCCRLVIFY